MTDKHKYETKKKEVFASYCCAQYGLQGAGRWRLKGGYI